MSKTIGYVVLKEDADENTIRIRAKAIVDDEPINIVRNTYGDVPAVLGILPYVETYQK